MEKPIGINIHQELIRGNSQHGSGQVSRLILKGRKTRLTQITTFCPGGMGPGPTNLYLIQGDALILVDTGMPTNAAKLLLYNLFDHPVPEELRDLPDDLSETELTTGLKVAGYSVKDIDLILITHGHWDHFLLGQRIKNMSSAKVLAHILDTPLICNPWTTGFFWASRHQQFEGMGMPNNISRFECFSHTLSPENLGFPLQIDEPIFKEGSIMGDQSGESIYIKHLPGHSPGSIGVFLGNEDESEILLCGDTLLYPISPHPDDLLSYLRTLAYLKTLKSIVLVLPAHGYKIMNIEERVGSLQKHHFRRLELTYKACRHPVSVWDIATMQDYFDIHVPRTKSNFIAGNEALLHLEVLKIVKAVYLSQIRDGIHYFEASGEPFNNVYSRIKELIDNKKCGFLMKC